MMRSGFSGFGIVVLSGAIAFGGASIPFAGPAYAQTATQETLSRQHLHDLAAELSVARNEVRGMTRTGGPSPFQEPTVLGPYRTQLETAKKALTPYVKSDDADVKAAIKAYKGLSEAMVREYGRGKKQVKEVGDIDERIAALKTRIDESISASPVPEPLEGPFLGERIAAWNTKAAAARKAIDGNRKRINRFVGLLYQAKAQPFVELDAGEAKRAEQVKTAARGLIKTLMADVPEDPTDARVLKRFNDDNDPGGAHALLAGSARAADLSADVATAAGLDATLYEKMSARIAKAKTGFDKAFNSERLPDPKSTDPARVAIAMEILAKPKYGFGEHGPIILTTPDIVAREKEESRETYTDVDVEANGDVTFSGTRETWTYKWDEFRFATPIKDDSGTWHIWWITAKKFSSGWKKTPIDVWISGKAVQGSVIPEARFRK